MTQAPPQFPPEGPGIYLYLEDDSTEERKARSSSAPRAMSSFDDESGAGSRLHMPSPRHLDDKPPEYVDPNCTLVGMECSQRFPLFSGSSTGGTFSTVHPSPPAELSPALSAEDAWPPSTTLTQESDYQEDFTLDYEILSRFFRHEQRRDLRDRARVPTRRHTSPHPAANNTDDSEQRPPVEQLSRMSIAASPEQSRSLSPPAPQPRRPSMVKFAAHVVARPSSPTRDEERQHLARPMFLFPLLPGDPEGMIGFKLLGPDDEEDDDER